MVEMGVGVGVREDNHELTYWFIAICKQVMAVPKTLTTYE